MHYFPTSSAPLCGAAVGQSQFLTQSHYLSTSSDPLCKSAVVWLVRVTYTFALLPYFLCSSVQKCCGMVGQSDLHICNTLPLPLLLCAKVLWYGWSERLTHLHYFPTPSTPLCGAVVGQSQFLTQSHYFLTSSAPLCNCCGMVGQSDLHICITSLLPLLLCAEVLWYGWSE